jgi:hypothetical protein
MRITESRLRQIIREEARHLVEMDGYAPGVAPPKEPDVSAEELSMILDAMEQGVGDRLQELGYDYESSTPEERKAAFEGHGLEMGPEEVYDTTSISEDYEDYIGQLVGGLEELTDGSSPPRIVNFNYADQPYVVLETDMGVMTLYLEDLRMH